MAMRADAHVYAGTFDADQSATTILPKGHQGWVQVARGSITVNGQILSEGDGLAITQAGRVDISDGRNAEILFFDLFG